MGKRVFSKWGVSLVKKSRNFWLMNFVELRILYLIDISKTPTVFSIFVYFQKYNSEKVTDHRYDNKIGLSVFDNLFWSIFLEELT